MGHRHYRMGRGDEGPAAGSAQEALIGPGQDERFVVSSFIKKILAIKKAGEERGIIETGDTTIVRDFIDVRDVVKAYYLLLLYGKIGEVYNICSGNGIMLDDLINMIALQLNVVISIKSNPNYIRQKN